MNKKYIIIGVVVFAALVIAVIWDGIALSSYEGQLDTWRQQATGAINLDH